MFSCFLTKKKKLSHLVSLYICRERERTSKANKTITYPITGDILSHPFGKSVIPLKYGVTVSRPT